MYEYVCDGCGEEFEEITSKFEPLRRCPYCEAPDLRQKLSAPTVVYHGPGFNTTDARGITGHKRKPNIKVGMTSDLPPEERERIGKRGA